MKARTSVLLTVILLGALGLRAVAQAQTGSAPLRVDLGAGVSMEMVLVKAGTLRQGSPASEAGRGDDETVREVTLTKDFYMGVHEVTVGQFKRFVEATRYRTEAEKGTSGGFGWTGQALEQRASFNWKNPGFPQTDAHPVTIVTFDDAMAFTRWLSGPAGRAVSLPTEAQWEFAARAASTSSYPSGAAKATEPTALGWSKANAGKGTHPVGEKSPNGIGLFDMAGNVAEWCLDWYGPYDPAALKDPVETRQNLSDKPRRVLRGGSWLRDARNGRSAARYRSTPGSRNADNGFRIVAAAAASAAPPATSASNPASGATSAASDSSELSTAGALGFLAVVLLAGAGALVVVWRLLSWLFRSTVTRLFPGDRAAGVKTRITPDGFTLNAPRVPMGHRIHYRYMVDGKPQTGSIVFSGDPDLGQTVYTGEKPSSVMVFAVTAPGEALPVAKARAVAAQDRVTRRTDDDSFRSYPSAYR